ncbi:carboxymuconolactone decarboxylase family protein [Roseicyclus sp.]|uniref:carboxymuconolactone decarboxylase family protein n=1 Tax=Roseicyclus sp. TaxID=1914329 RepID=UPI003F6A31CC
MMPRLPDLNPDTLTPDQRRVHDAIVAGPRGAVQGPLRVWLTSPALADRAQALGQFARFDSSLSHDLSELAILVTARIWSSGFEWRHHAPIAQAAGVPEAAIAAIGAAQRPQFDCAKQKAVFECAVELHRDHKISDASFAAGMVALGEVGMVDLVGVCGYYTLISMTINAFEVPDGDGPELPQLTLPVSEYFRS